MDLQSQVTLQTTACFLADIFITDAMVKETEIILPLFCGIDLRLAGLLICEALDHTDIGIARLVIRQHFADISVTAQILVDLAGCFSSGGLP